MHRALAEHNANNKNTEQNSQLDYDLIFYLEAFQELDSCRSDGLSAIFWTAIKEYGVFHEIHNFDFFYNIINYIDRLVLDNRRKVMEKEKRNATKRNKSQRR